MGTSSERSPSLCSRGVQLAPDHGLSPVQFGCAQQLQSGPGCVGLDRVDGSHALLACCCSRSQPTTATWFVDKHFLALLLLQASLLNAHWRGVFFSDYQYQTIINAAPEPLNAANLASAAYQPAQSQLYSQWGFVHNPSYPGPQQPWFNAAAQPEQQQPLRAYTPSYTSRSSMDGSVLPSSPMPMHHQQPHYQSHSPSQQQQQQQHQQHQGWRDTAQDDGLSLYSASSISRPSTPSNYQSFYNSPSLMPSDDPNSPLPKPQDGLLTAARPDAGAQHQQLQHQQHLLEDPASHQLTSLGPPVADRHATIQPGFAPYPGPPSRDTTMGFGGGSSSASPQPASHEASSVAPPPTVSFLGQDFSTSPTASPKASAMHDFSSSHPVDPSEQGGPAQQTPYLMPQPSKTNSLSRLDIPMAPSIEFEAATATAGPGTARPNGQTSTQLDRMIAQSRGVSGFTLLLPFVPPLSDSRSFSPFRFLRPKYTLCDFCCLTHHHVSGGKPPRR